MVRPAQFFAIIIPVTFVSAMTWFGVFTLVNAYMVRGLGASDADWATAMVWYLWGLTFWEVLAAPIAARLGRVNSITLVILVAALCYSLIGATTNRSLIGLLLGVMSVTQAVLSVVFLPLVAELGGNRPGRALGLFQWVQTIATAVGLISGGALADHAIYVPTFLGIAALFVVAAGLFHAAVKRAPRRPDEHPPLAVYALSRADLRAMVTGPFVAVLLLGFCVEPFYFTLVNQLTPNLGRGYHGLSERSIGELMALGRLPSLLTLGIVAHRIDRGHPLRYYGASMIISSTTTILLAWMTGMSGFILIFLAYWAGQGAVWGADMASMNAVVPRRLREVAFTILCLAQAVTQTAATWWQEVLLRHGCSLRAVFTCSAAVGVAGGAALLFYGMRTGAPRPEPDPAPTGPAEPITRVA